MRRDYGLETLLKRRTFDHIHQLGREVIQHYEFHTAEQLLADFFSDADKLLDRLRNA